MTKVTALDRCLCRVERGKKEDWKGQKRSKVKRVTLFHSKPVNEDLFWIQILAFSNNLSELRAWNSMTIQIVARVVCQLYFSTSKLHKIGSYFSPGQRYSESLFSTFCYVLYLTMNYGGLSLLTLNIENRNWFGIDRFQHFFRSYKRLPNKFGQMTVKAIIQICGQFLRWTKIKVVEY